MGCHSLAPNHAAGEPERMARLYVMRTGDPDADAKRRDRVREAFLAHVDAPD